jgi:hypothetical protein
MYRRYYIENKQILGIIKNTYLIECTEESKWRGWRFHYTRILVYRHRHKDHYMLYAPNGFRVKLVKIKSEGERFRIVEEKIIDTEEFYKIFMDYEDMKETLSKGAKAKMVIRYRIRKEMKEKYGGESTKAEIQKEISKALNLEFES